LIVMYVTVQHFLETRSKRPRAWRRGTLALRFAIPTICFMTILAIAVTVLMGKTGGLYWFVPVVISLVWDASLDAWDLLLRLRDPARRI